jgi:hypothetical protein
MEKLKYFFKWVGSFFPEKLPQGMTKFNELVDDIARLSGLPYNDKLKKVTAMFILQLPPVVSSVSKRYIIKQLQKAAANQVAVAAMKEVAGDDPAKWNLNNGDDKQSTAQELDKKVGPQTKR